jgi:tryptophan synthase alpha chain
VDAGADAIEIGVPYSDPGIDGPVIQQAVDVAVRAGVGMRDVLRAVEAVADAGAVPVVMSYWNPIERYGVDRFATDLAAAGGAGAITPDLIPDEAGEWLAASERTGLDRVFLVAPSSTETRLRSTTAACRGFVYAASTMGVTGARATVGDAAEKLVARTRAVAPDLAVCVGLGVSNGAQAAEVAAFADGVIVGSAYVREMLEGRGAHGVRALSEELAKGVRA